MEITTVDLQDCQEDTVATMDFSAMVAQTAIGGVLRYGLFPHGPYTAVWTTALEILAMVTTISFMDFLFDVSGINLFVLFVIIYSGLVESNIFVFSHFAETY